MQHQAVYFCFHANVMKSKNVMNGIRTGIVEREITHECTNIHSPQSNRWDYLNMIVCKVALIQVQIHFRVPTSKIEFFKKNFWNVLSFVELHFYYYTVWGNWTILLRKETYVPLGKSAAIFGSSFCTIPRATPNPKTRNVFANINQNHQRQKSWGCARTPSF